MVIALTFKDDFGSLSRPKISMIKTAVALASTEISVYRGMNNE